MLLNQQKVSHNDAMCNSIENALDRETSFDDDMIESIHKILYYNDMAKSTKKHFLTME